MADKPQLGGEKPSGDQGTPPIEESRQAALPLSHSPSAQPPSGFVTASTAPIIPGNSPASPTAPFQQQIDSFHQQQLQQQQQHHHHHQHQHQQPRQLQPQGQPGTTKVPATTRTSPYNLASLGGALAEKQPGQSHHQRFLPGASGGAPVYQQQQPSQFAGQTANSYQATALYQQQYPNPYLAHLPNVLPLGQPQYYPPGQAQPTGNNSQQLHPSTPWPAGQHQQHYQSYYYYPTQPLQAAAGYSSHLSSPYAPTPFQQRQNIPQTQAPLHSRSDFDASARPTPSAELASAGGIHVQYSLEALSESIPESTRNLSPSSILRGPPRKPKQSGFALWVGNLPPSAMITDLKDHFARDATNDIESVFLISKSNCAFVNYKTEAACAAAMTRFHDSKFQSVRLVCRLRRNSANPAASSGAAASRSSSLSITAPGSFAEEAKASKDDIPKSRLPVDVQLADGIVPKSKVTQSEGERTAVRNKERFFILKSLTVDDLELSARSGIWATQAHNEESLNKAYESSESVYLIFSANKSGEYFGYARMLSPINDETASSIQWAPTSSSIMFTEAQDVPKAISTPATACAPAGRIIDDSARGTIFWEADSEDLDQAVAGHVNKDGNVEEEGEAIGDKSDAEGDYDGTPGDQSSLDTKVWGKPFRVQWISTNRLPFYRTRGLRNALNVNREVKIARDGTELETVVGKKLIQMFQRPPPSSVSPAGSEHGPPDGQASFGAHPQGQLGAQHHY